MLGQVGGVGEHPVAVLALVHDVQVGAGGGVLRGNEQSRRFQKK